MQKFVEEARGLLGQTNVLTTPDAIASYLTEWRGLYTGRTPAVLKPGTTAEVSALMRLATNSRVSIVPQGGNTGLVGGQIPSVAGDQVLLSLGRLNRIRAVDAAANTMTVDAGAILAKVQREADAHERLFPLSLASEGSATIGGLVSTNAGGTGVLAYGNMRELVLGLEAVMPNGEIWNGLGGLRKDNTGYDLKQLFIGAEGTLGVVTAATLKLFPKPAAIETAIAAVADVEGAVTLLSFALRRGAIMPEAPLTMAGCLRDGAPDAWGRRVIINRLTGLKGDAARDVEFDELTFLLNSGSDRAGALDFQLSADRYQPREQRSGTRWKAARSCVTARRSST